MAFELVACRTTHNPSLPIGRFRLDRAGKITLCLQDLNRAGVKYDLKPTVDIAILIDKATRRIAVRAFREDDQGYPFRFRWGKRKTGVPPRGTCSIRSALVMIGADRAAVAGEYDVAHKDGLLILDMGLAADRRAARSNKKNA